MAKEPTALKIHHLRPAPGAKTAKTRVGRGQGSKGKTAGRGTKGTKSRYQVPESFEGGQMPMHMRLPKLRGFKNPFRKEYQGGNLDPNPLRERGGRGGVRWGGGRPMAGTVASRRGAGGRGSARVSGGRGGWSARSISRTSTE